MCEDENAKCPLESIAPYQWAEELVLGFYEARCMYEITKSNLVYEKALIQLGLIDDLAMLQTLELAFIDVKNFKNKQELLKQKISNGNK